MLRLLVFLCFICPKVLAINLITGDWDPFIDSKTDSGILTEIIKASLAEVQESTTIDYYPWKRVELMVNQRHAISYGWSYGKARARKWEYSAPLYKSSDLFLIRKDAVFNYSQPQDLKNYKIGHVIGFGIPETLQPIWHELNVIQVNTSAQILQMILTSRIDVVIINPLVAQKILTEHFPSPTQKQFTFYRDKPVESYELHAICARTYPNCHAKLEKINQGLALIKQNGIYQQIVDKYEGTSLFSLHKPVMYDEKTLIKQPI